MTPSITKSLSRLVTVGFTSNIDLPLPPFEPVAPAESVDGIHKVTRKHTGDATASVEDA